MKILLTGATGWIGKSLGTALVKRGHTLICLVRNAESAQMNCPFPAEYVEWKNIHEPFNETQCQNVDAIINLMGESIATKRWNAEIKKEILESRIHSMSHLVNFAKKNNVKHFISASAVGFYGDRPNEILTENFEFGNGFLADVCKQWEETLFGISEYCRCVALRIGIVLGGDGGALEKMVPLYKFGVGGNIGNGEQFMSWIHISDLLNLMIFALENTQCVGPINATAPQPVQQKEFSKTLAHVLHRPACLPVPKFALKFLLGEMSQLILASINAVPKKAQEFGFSFQYKNIEEALSAIFGTQDSNENQILESQYINKSIKEVFAFYADAYNLEKITPDFLKFKVLAKSTPQIENNTLIDYKLSLHGIPIKWQSKILEWSPPNKFVDVQIKGPYHKWHHTHTFETLGSGTLIVDCVSYQLPFGFLGFILVGWKVKRDLKLIFQYRRKIVFNSLFQKTF